MLLVLAPHALLTPHGRVAWSRSKHAHTAEADGMHAPVAEGFALDSTVWRLHTHLPCRGTLQHCSALCPTLQTPAAAHPASWICSHPPELAVTLNGLPLHMFKPEGA